MSLRGRSPPSHVSKPFRGLFSLAVGGQSANLIKSQGRFMLPLSYSKNTDDFVWLETQFDFYFILTMLRLNVIKNGVCIDPAS